ncbi:MAG: hypothetical protein J6T35_02195 [Bacteroidales bacterium]|nr:hypothetical protein [Bacteroidales bacterium]
MSKRAEDLAKQLYPDPKLEDYDDILVYRADRDNALVGRTIVKCVYEQAEKDLGWHSVDECLPEIDEEVIALTNQMHGKELDTARVICFAHRPDPNGWDGRSLSTGKVEHFDVETYNGWNIPGVKYWMPCPKIPNEEEI